MTAPSLLSPVGGERPRSHLQRVLRRLRLPLRRHSEVETNAAETRAARLFAVNFRHPWTR